MPGIDLERQPAAEPTRGESGADPAEVTASADAERIAGLNSSHSVVFGLFALALLALLALLGYVGLRLSRAENLKVYWDAPSFVLTDQLERTVSSDELRGKIVVANFVYTNCPDICPLLSLRMQSLQERLRQAGLLGSQVRLLSFTVDPARDTPAVLRAYAERHRADSRAWRFLTGPEEDLAPLIVDGFRLGVQALPPTTAGQSGHGDGNEPHGQYEVKHSGRFVLIDRQWRLRAYYDGTELDLERVLRDIRQLLR